MTEGGPADDLRSPVVGDGNGEQAKGVEEGLALCLSGGGYRAMLFHAGVLWRLNELGFLPRLARISSVSGGSIVAAVLGRSWSSLSFGADGVAADLVERVIEPVRQLAGTTIDIPAGITGLLLPGSSIADRVAHAYRRRIFGDTTLQDLPDSPRFVINATNIQTGRLWRFSKPYMGDYKVGRVFDPEVALATAVAASSAFPPFLSPLVLAVDGMGDVVLSDGGVYDNLGLETAWKRYRTILVSDGGGQMKPEPKPKRNWLSHAVRVNQVIDDQVRNLRKRWAVGSFVSGDREGAYWSIRSDPARYGPPPGSLPAPSSWTDPLAATKTRLKALPARHQEALIDWGYAICDVALRCWVDPDAPPPEAFPYPAAGPAR